MGNYWERWHKKDLKEKEARGFEVLDADGIFRYSPTASKDSLRLSLLSIVSSENWGMGCMNVHTAFLQGKKINRDV